MQAERAEEV